MELKELDELIKADPQDRAARLGFWTAAQRELVLSAWAEDARLRLADIVSLAEPHRTDLIRKVGNGRIFYLQPSPTWEPPSSMRDIPAEVWQRIKEDGVLVEDGRKRGETVHFKIDRPTALPAQKAIHAMLLFGPSADHEMMRGRLVELSEQEFYDAQRTGKKK